MYIDVVKDYLILADNQLELLPRHVSQLQYWGFSREPDRKIYRASFDNIILTKLLSYLLKQKLSYSLSPVL